MKMTHRSRDDCDENTVIMHVMTYDSCLTL